MEGRMDCNCLCVINHKGKLGVCTGGSTTTLRFTNFGIDCPIIKMEIDVKMCEPCRLMTLAQQQESN